MPYENYDITSAQLCDGFVYRSDFDPELRGMGGKLQIQPEYKRNYIYEHEDLEEGII